MAGPGVGLLEDPGQAQGEVVAVAGDGDLEADRQAVAGEAGRAREIDGFQQRLASIVKGVAIAPPGGGPSAAKAGTAVVGVRSTSTSREEPGRIERELLATAHRAGELAAPGSRWSPRASHASSG